MKKKILLVSILAWTGISAQDTFSICAVDTVTGEVGSAGASCIDANSIATGVLIISDIHNGVGVIHTQSYWDPSNQLYAQQLMNAGISPQQIMDSVVANDISNNPGIRQYGAVDLFNGGARSAAYTGPNCMNYKNHILGPNYAIQGNILLGQQILDSMEARFLNTPGDLACKLMAALQGAKVIGADTRCTISGNSSLSSFLRVACPADAPGTYSIDVVVPEGPPGFEPIDSAQTLFNLIHNCSTPLVCGVGIDPIVPENDFSVTLQPNPVTESSTLIVHGNKKQPLTLFIYSSGGALVIKSTIRGKFDVKKEAFKKGIYYYQVISDSGNKTQGKFVIVN